MGIKNDLQKKNLIFLVRKKTSGKIRHFEKQIKNYDEFLYVFKWIFVHCNINDYEGFLYLNIILSL